MRDINRYTDDYLKESFEDYQVFYRRKKVLEVLEKYPHHRIIEIGCGMEPLFAHAEGAEEYDKYYVVEPSPVFFENAKKIAYGNNKVTCLKEYFYASKELIEANPDFVICSSLLHEIDDCSSFLEQIYKVCGKDTVVHINVPNANSFHRRLAYHMGLIPELEVFSERNVLLQQKHVFSLKSLKEIVAGLGWEILDSGSYFLKPFTHHQMHKILQENIIDLSTLDGLYNMGESNIADLGSEIYVNIKPGE